ncbi:unnamed protein product, partial [Musa acuminata subsp. burmannicoides]
LLPCLVLAFLTSFNFGRFSSSWSPVHWTGRGERICRLKATPAGVTKGDLLVSTWMIVFGCHGR